MAARIDLFTPLAYIQLQQRQQRQQSAMHRIKSITETHAIRHGDHVLFHLKESYETPYATLPEGFALLAKVVGIAEIGGNFGCFEVMPADCKKPIFVAPSEVLAVMPLFKTVDA